MTLINYDCRLADNPICRESDVTDKFCSPQTNITTYSTPWNYCPPPSCGLGQVSSPNCQCACPYIGSIFFKVPSFSSLENSTIYISLHDSLMTFFHEAGLPVNSLSLQNPRRNMDDYLVIDLKLFPSGEPSFNRTGILGLAFAFSNQTFQPPTEFNIYYFIPEPYSNFLKGNVFLYDAILIKLILLLKCFSTCISISLPFCIDNESTKHKSSKAGVITGSVVGGCMLVVLFVLAGMHFFRQKERAERPPQHSQPFGKYGHFCTVTT